MTSGAFNLEGEALRKLLICAVDVSEESTPVWEVQGYKTEDAGIEFNPDVATVTDVLGDTYTDINKFEKQIPFEPNTLRLGTRLSELLHKYERNDQLEKFSQFHVLIGYGYLGTKGAYEADVYDACTIVPQSLGGSSRVNFPFQINFGGAKTKGTINKLRGSDISFVPTIDEP